MKHWIVGAISALAMSGAAQAADVMKMAVTTSFNNSGLADVLLPQIAADLDLDVQLLVVGTGQAIKLGESGDVDAILVHSRKAEEAFVDAGFGSHRTEIMYNDFVFIGPKSDPAGIASSGAATEALSAIADKESDFVSRGDDSGTHKKELSLCGSRSGRVRGLVQRRRGRHGGGAQQRLGDARLCDVGPGKLAELRQ